MNRQAVLTRLKGSVEEIRQRFLGKALRPQVRQAIEREMINVT